MLPLRYARRWQVASLLILLFVLIAALMPAIWFWDDRATVMYMFDSVDKWLHGVTFLVLSLWFTGLYPKESYWRVGIALLAFGLAIEACQRIVSYRTADWVDVGADAAGIVVGLLIAVAGVGGWCLRIENRLASTGGDID